MAQTEIGQSVGEYAKGAKPTALEVREPENVCLALEMLSFGAPYSEIAQKTGLRPSSISKLKMRHQGAVDERRMRAADEGEHVADTYLEALKMRGDDLIRNADERKKVNPKDLAFTYGILTDKAAQNRGEGVGPKDQNRGVSLEDAAELIAAAAERIRVKRIEEAVDV
jgi:hypothetical protein